MRTLNQVMPDWINKGIFSSLDVFDVPWKGDNVSRALDIDYHGGISGGKPISQLVERVISGDTLSDSDITLICTSIMAVYGVKWSKLWTTLSLEYNPIENYSMVETMTNDKTVTNYGRTITRTDNLTHSTSSTDTQQNSQTQSNTQEDTANINRGVYGFNSTEATPSEVESQTKNMTQNVSITDNKEGTTQTTSTDGGTQTSAEGGEDSNTRNYTLTRKGNIGVTTSQQMIESERALWMWDFFRQVVYPDIDKMLTLAIY